MQCSKCSTLLYFDEKKQTYKFDYSYKFICQECDIKNNIIREDENYTVTTILSVYPVFCSLCNKNVYTRKISLYFDYTLCQSCNKQFTTQNANLGISSQLDRNGKNNYIISNKSRWSKDCDICKSNPKDSNCEFVDNLKLIYICKECDLFYGANLFDLKTNHYYYYGNNELKNTCWNCQQTDIFLRFANAYLIHLQCCNECYTKHFDKVTNERKTL